MNTILDLIERGESDILLSDDKHLANLKDLIKYELLEVKNGSIILTEKGSEFQHLKIDEVLNQEKSRKLQKRVEDAKANWADSNENVFQTYFFILLIMASFYLVYFLI